MIWSIAILALGLVIPVKYLIFIYAQSKYAALFSCPNCGEVFGLKMPVRCRRCRKTMPRIHFFSDFLIIVCTLVLFIVHGDSLGTWLAAIFAAALIVSAFVDAFRYIIPDSMIIAIIALGILKAVMGVIPLADQLIGMAAVTVPLLVVVCVTRGRGMGLGDLKLSAAGGLFLGWKLVACGFFIALLAATLCLLPLVLMRRLKTSDKVPFGPFLCLGMYLSLLLDPWLFPWINAMQALIAG